MEFGYARLSTTPEDLDRQVHALLEHGIPDELIYRDTMIGVTRRRPGFSRLLASVGDGDTIVVTDLDRLGCTVEACLKIVHDVAARGIGITALHDPIPAALPALITQMQHVFEQERAARGVRLRGRPSKLDADQVAAARAAIAARQPVGEVAASLGVSRATLYRHLSSEDQ